jgi:hypothetical protein
MHSPSADFAGLLSRDPAKISRLLGKSAPVLDLFPLAEHFCALSP